MSIGKSTATPPNTGVGSSHDDARCAPWVAPKLERLATSTAELGAGAQADAEGRS